MFQAKNTFTTISFKKSYPKEKFKNDNPIFYFAK